MYHYQNSYVYKLALKVNRTFLEQRKLLRSE
jgi:hypothetical protein